MPSYLRRGRPSKIRRESVPPSDRNERSAADALTQKGTHIRFDRSSGTRSHSCAEAISQEEGGKMKLSVRKAMLGLGLAGVVTAVVVAPGGATPPSGLTNVPLARGVNMSEGTIPLQRGTDIAMAQITVNPGGSSGWHSHPGGAIVVVKEGSLTVYESVGGQCETSTYAAGQAFIERPGEVDQVINTGTVPYVLFVTFPRVPQGTSARTDEPDPGTCAGL